MEIPPLLPASDADETGDISIPIATATRKRRYQRKYPLYEESDLFPIIRHLAICLETAERTLKTFRRMKQGSERHKAIDGSVLYWEHVCSTIKWLVHKAYQPQRHLTEVSREELEQCLTRILSDSGK